MPKGAHLKKEHDAKRVKSILLRFTQQEFNQLQNYCRGLGVERSEIVRDIVFKVISGQQPSYETTKEPVAPPKPEIKLEPVAGPINPQKSVEEFLEELVEIYQTGARKRNFDRKVDCNVYRATIYEFNNLLHDYSQKALREEFERYCAHLYTADFINSHLFRGFELHVSDNFVFWNKHNRGSSNYVGY